METKANTALIGAFTLIVLALAFVFIYWLARGSEQGTNTPLKIIFNDPVTGLGVASKVVFNGIDIGTVKKLTLDPDNPKAVIAELTVQPLRSIKEDTQVTLGFQGLTGVGYVEMAGGSPDKQPIWTAMKDPTIVAVRSSMQDLMAGARTILARADETLQSVEKIVSENTDDVTQAVRDVRRFTGALSQNSDGVAKMIDQISAASASIADATSRLQGIVERGEAVIAAVDPEQVRATVDSIQRTTASVAGQIERFDRIAGRADQIAADVQGFSQHLPALGEKADALAQAVDPAKLGAAIDRFDALTAAIDPEAVRTTVDNAAKTAAAIGAQSEAIGSIVARADAIAGNLDSFSQRLPALGDKADALAGAIDPAKVAGTLERLDAITAAVDPERVRTTVDGAAALGETLQANRENIDAIVARLTALSGDIAAFSPRLPAIGEKTDALLAAIDTAKVGRTLENVDQFTTALAANTDDIDAIVADAKRVSARFDSLATRADSLMAKLDSMAGEGTGGILEDAKQTLAAVRAAANSFSAQVNTVGGGLGDFSGRGLRDFQNLISEGQRAISRLDGVVSDLEQNPSGFLFGGSSVPEYEGRRR